MVGAPATSQLPDGGRFVALDSWRGIAALMVVAYHIQEGGLAFFFPLASQGWIAVDFFFVLSGFVISAAYETRLSTGFPVARFMFLRVGRVYPLHLTVLALYVAAELFKVLLAQAGLGVEAPFSTKSDVGELVITALLLQVFIQPENIPWSPASWSIAVEVWLYLLAAVAWRLLDGRAWLAAALVSFGALAWLAGSFEPWSDTFSPEFARGLAAFGLGMVCWRAWDGGLGARWARLSASAALALEILAIGFVVAMLALALPIPVADFAFAFLVLAFAADRGGVSRLLATTPFVWLGVLSYSIYLVHLLVLLVVRTLFEAAVPAPGPVQSTFAGLGVVVASIGVAFVTWRLVEAPAREWSRRRAVALGAGPEERVVPTI